MPLPIAAAPLLPMLGLTAAFGVGYVVGGGAEGLSRTVKWVVIGGAVYVAAKATKVV